MRSCLYAAFVVAAMAALILLSPAAMAGSFNYLYIEASEGNSSGGHTAIQFDDDIYHYQHVDPGLIRLFKLEKNDFHFLYRYLQNRPIHQSRIEVTEDTFQMLHDQFKWRFLIQERQFKLLDDLYKDRIFIRRMLHRLTANKAMLDSDASSILHLKGVGLFFKDQNHDHQQKDSELTKQQSLSIKKMRQKLEQLYGADFLRRKRNSLELQIKTLTPLSWPVIDREVSSENFPFSLYSFADRYSDYLTGLFAIKVLVEARPLQSDAFFQLHQNGFKISDSERSLLQHFRNRLESSFVQSINSVRPDWGYAVLINLARYLAVDASLKSGYWMFIDDFDNKSEIISPEEYLQHGSQIRILISDATSALDRIRQSLKTAQHLGEAEYNRFEMSANRYYELLKSEHHIEFRYNGEKALPQKSISFPESPMPNLTEKQLTTALSSLDHFESSLLQKLEQENHYNLINRNCVTELFRTINQALLTPYGPNNKLLEPDALAVEESETRLGGYIDIAFNFIPFISYQSVMDHYKVISSRNLHSFRSQELAKINTRQNKLITALTESNILSSRLYEYNSDDALFVFFTDDNVLMRPIFGLVNTAAGISQSIYGLFSWPFDNGKNLKSGATGMLMSLPELVFFNMRKGSYKYLSFNQLNNSDLSN